MSEAAPDVPAPLSLDFLHEQLGFNLRLAYMATNRDFNDRLAELNLTQRQCIALQLIAANAGVSQIDMASALGIDRSSMMAIADELQTRHFIARRKSKADGRRQELRLTQRGTAVLKRLRNLLRDHNAHMAERLTKKELAFLLDALRRIHQRF